MNRWSNEMGYWRKKLFLFSNYSVPCFPWYCFYDGGIMLISKHTHAYKTNAQKCMCMGVLLNPFNNPALLIVDKIQYESD